jgi:hypothetical protein
MSSLHDMAILSVLNKLSILIDKLNKLADDELERRGVNQEAETAA